MKKNKKSPYPASDKTRHKILKAAKALFVDQGFAATSISQIAAKAAINQSLIYHHFGNKEKLWKAVKQTLFEAAAQNEALSTEQAANLKIFLEKMVIKRLEFYLENPEMARMMG